MKLSQPVDTSDDLLARGVVAALREASSIEVFEHEEPGAAPRGLIESEAGWNPGAPPKSSGVVCVEGLLDSVGVELALMGPTAVPAARVLPFVGRAHLLDDDRGALVELHSNDRPVTAPKRLHLFERDDLSGSGQLRDMGSGLGGKQRVFHRQVVSQSARIC